MFTYLLCITICSRQPHALSMGPHTMHHYAIWLKIALARTLQARGTPMSAPSRKFFMYRLCITIFQRQPHALSMRSQHALSV